MPVGSDEDERLIQKMNEKAVDVHKEKVLKEPNSTKVLKIEVRNKVGKQTHADDERSDKGVDSSKKKKACPRMKRMYKRHRAECIYYRIFRSDGSSRWIKTFVKMMTRRYPLTTKTLERMLSLRLIDESASDAAYDLLRFV
nr:hypothetical protein [Tanacetum cinerariifolium]